MRPSFVRLVLVCALAATVAFVARPAAAQTSVAQKSSDASEGRVFLVLGAGAGAVQKVGATAGGQLGFHLSDRMDLFAEAVWMQNVVTRRRLDDAVASAAELQRREGGTASASMTAPAVYAGAGVNLLLKTRGRLRPYVTVSGGMARVALRPVFTLAGADVTSSLSNYGFTLGSDLTGESTKPAIDAGAGVRLLHQRWYIDTALRVTSIRIPGQPTNVIRASVGVGFAF